MLPAAMHTCIYYPLVSCPDYFSPPRAKNSLGTKLIIYGDTVAINQSLLLPAGMQPAHAYETL